MYDFFNSTLLSNIIGMFSLLISLISFCVSLRTLNTADEIKNEIRKNQIKALNRKKFIEDKPKIANELQEFLILITNKPTLSQKNAKRIFICFCDILKHDTILTKDDLDHLVYLRNEQQKICDKIRNKEQGYQAQCIKNITEAIKIINKGDYDL